MGKAKRKREVRAWQAWLGGRGFRDTLALHWFRVTPQITADRIEEFRRGWLGGRRAKARCSSSSACGVGKCSRTRSNQGILEVFLKRRFFRHKRHQGTSVLLALQRASTIWPPGEMSQHRPSLGAQCRVIPLPRRTRGGALGWTQADPTLVRVNPVGGKGDTVAPVCDDLNRGLRWMYNPTQGEERQAHQRDRGSCHA